jgi:cobalt/nickel transport system permease protein
MLGVMGAAVTVISVWPIPVPVTGSSSHPVGTPMAAILVGPFPAILLSFVALILHIFVAHGGITTLGANTFSMGVVGSFVGYGVYRLARRWGAGFWLAAGLAGFLGDMAVYATTALELALALFPDSVLQHFVIFFLGFGPTQVPLAAMEFLFTGAIINHIMKVRPDIAEALEEAAHGA